MGEDESPGRPAASSSLPLPLLEPPLLDPPLPEAPLLEPPLLDEALPLPEPLPPLTGPFGLKVDPGLDASIPSSISPEVPRPQATAPQASAAVMPLRKERREPIVRLRAL
jgi:hypothetical protein